MRRVPAVATGRLPDQSRLLLRTLPRGSVSETETSLDVRSGVSGQNPGLRGSELLIGQISAPAQLCKPLKVANRVFDGRFRGLKGQWEHSHGLSTRGASLMVTVRQVDCRGATGARYGVQRSGLLWTRNGSLLPSHHPILLLKRVRGAVLFRVRSDPGRARHSQCAKEQRLAHDSRFFSCPSRSSATASLWQRSHDVTYFHQTS